MELREANRSQVHHWEIPTCDVAEAPHAVLRMLLLLSQITSITDAISAFVLDYKEAVWQVPVRPDERQYFYATAKPRGTRRWLAYMRTAQGSANAPLLWARLAALIMRLAQSLFLLEELSLMCYVDDRLAVLRRADDERELFAAIMVFVWEALGFQLA